MSDALPARPVAGGRIVLDTFRSAHDPMLGSWLLFRAQILADSEVRMPQRRPDDRAAAPGQGLYGVWRVLATNNRELARGASLHPSPVDAFVDAESAKAAADTLTSSVVRGSQPMTHGWVLRREGAPVLTASRWYESASEANAAAKAARKALAAATIVHGVSMGTQSGRRHRRALTPTEPRD
jgi:hypothetical protein